MGELERVLRDGLRGDQVVLQLLVLRQFAGEDVADLVGNLLAVGVDRVAGEVLVVGHLVEDGLDLVRHAAGNLVHLLVLHLLGFLGGLWEGIVGLDLLGDGLGEGVDLVGVELVDLVVGHEHVGLALRNGVLEQLVGGLDLPAVFVGGELQRLVLVPEGGQLGLLPGSHVIDGLLVQPERGSRDQEGGENDGRELFFEFLPHGRGGVMGGECEQDGWEMQ